MVWKSLQNPALVVVASLGVLLSGCATSISGKVVRPDGSALTHAEVVVYTDPKTESARADADGIFKIGQNVVPNSEYTLTAEDREGNLGYVRGFKPKKGANKGVVIRLSREVNAKDAVLEGSGGPSETGSGPGEKILKSSQ